MPMKWLLPEESLHGYSRRYRQTAMVSSLSSDTPCYYMVRENGPTKKTLTTGVGARVRNALNKICRHINVLQQTKMTSMPYFRPLVLAQTIVMEGPLVRGRREVHSERRCPFPKAIN